MKKWVAKGATELLKGGEGAKELLKGRERG
jgi:hypothetical protein